MVSCYRAPGVDTIRNDGGIVARMQRQLSLPNPDAVHKRFYADLGHQLDRWSALGHEIILQGDLNATIRRGVETKDRPADLQLTEWAERQGLELLEFEEGRKACTFEVNRGKTKAPARRQLDVILVSSGLAKMLKAEALVKTCELSGVAQGHRALSWFSAAALTDWLGLRQKAQAWTKEQQRVAEAESLRVADSRLLIQAGSEAEEAYVEALGDEPSAELVAMVEQLEALDLSGRERAGQLISRAEGLFNAAYLAAAVKALPRKGRQSSRRAPEGWHPGLEKERIEYGQIDKLLTRLHQPDGWRRGLALLRKWKADGR